MNNRIILVVLGREFSYISKESIQKLPKRDKDIFIEGTADSIVALQVMEPLFPVFIFADGSVTIKSMIEDRVLGLLALGVEDEQAEIEKAYERMKLRFDENHIKQAILHLGGI